MIAKKSIYETNLLDGRVPMGLLGMVDPYQISPNCVVFILTGPI